MIGESWIIYWNEYASDTYLYGSEIEFLAKDDVKFKNLLMPPGTVIKQWYSKTNFQFQQIEPSLPMIDGEARYRMIVNMDVPEYEECFIKLVYVDKYDNEFDSIIIKDRVTEFKCPLRTYSFKMQLINGGVSVFRFHSVVIQELVDEK